MGRKHHLAASLLLVAGVFLGVPIAAQTEVINEPFLTTDTPAGLTLIGTTAIVDDGCGNNEVFALS